MGRGREALKRCNYCGKLYPLDKMVRSTKYSFSYHDPEAGLNYRGQPMTVYVCRACARHRGVKDQRREDARNRRSPTERRLGRPS